MGDEELRNQETAFFESNVEGLWDSTGVTPIPEPPMPYISDNIAIIIDGENFIELSNSHYLEIDSNLNLPADFFGIDSYLINIKINDEIKQVRFNRNTTNFEKYGTTIYEYENYIYEYMIYIINDGYPIVKISSATLGVRENG